MSSRLYAKREHNSNIKKTNDLNIKRIQSKKKSIQMLNKITQSDDNDIDINSEDSLNTVDEILKKDYILDSDLEYVKNRMLTDDDDEFNTNVNRIISDLRKNLDTIIEDTSEHMTHVKNNI